MKGFEDFSVARNEMQFLVFRGSGLFNVLSLCLGMVIDNLKAFKCRSKAEGIQNILAETPLQMGFIVAFFSYFR